MANEETKVDEFLTGLDKEEVPDILQTTEKKEEEVKEEAREEKPLPFHKDPKVQRYIEKEISKRIPEAVSKEEEPSTADIDEVLTRIIGNDTEEKKRAIADFKKVLIEREDRGAEKAFERWQAEQAEEVQAEKEAEDELVSGFEAIEEEYGVDLDANRKLKGQFIDFIRKVAHKNEDGEVTEFPDLVETFDAFQAMHKTESPATKAKELASRGTERGSSTPAPVVEDKSWHAVDRIFDRLTGK